MAAVVVFLRKEGAKLIASVSAAKWAMKLRPNFPHFDSENVGMLREVFNHEYFLTSSEETKNSILLKSSQSKYKDEFSFPFDSYFGFDLKPRLLGCRALDLGCFTGGRTAAWLERYDLESVAGIDIDPLYIKAARAFAAFKGTNGDYKVGFGEDIPFPDASFDAVLTFDVLEHVVDIEKTMKECHRILRPGGRMFVVFPTYLQPVEHHLGMVTRVPGLQYIFSGRCLVRAYYELIEERGADAYWYRRDSPHLAAHEAGHTINGTSFRQFQALTNEHWRKEFVCHKPIGSVGRMLADSGWIAKLASILSPLTYVPFLQEFLLHRVTMILVKP